MGFLVAIIVVVLVGLVILVVGAPLRATRRADVSMELAGVGSETLEPAHQPVLERDQLDAAREAKYREIRDLELDYRTGKLSLDDYEAIDAQLRTEAIEILNRIQDDREPVGDADTEPG